MNKINTTPRVSKNDPVLERVLREHALLINALAEGRMAAAYNALTAPPTGGTWALGDFVKNSAPSELGTSPNKYIIDGWRCVAGGTPGTWVQCRYLTGN